MTREALIQRVRDTIHLHQMLAPGDTVVVGASGGRDSTALFHILTQMREDLRLTIHAAYFDHGLRPDAAEDAALVAALSRTLGYPFHNGAGDARAYAQRMRLSVEDACRRLRYEYLLSVAHTVGAQALATGHTRDDQAETVLMRVIRGGGPTGLAGIPPVRVQGEVRVIRPLIGVSRAETAEYLTHRGISWRDDPTNTDLSILRNHIRWVTLPFLEGYNPDVRPTLARLADLLRDEGEALDALAGPLIAETLAGGPGVVRIALERFARLPVAVQRRALREAVRRARGTIASVAFVHIEGARRLALDGRTGAVLELPGGVRVVRQAEALEVAAGAATPPGEATAGEYRLPVPGSVVAAEYGVQVVASEVSADAPDIRERAGHPSPGEIVVDRQRAGSGLILRGPRPGDRFAPFGMGGRRKKISDFLRDAGVPAYRRRWVPVLTTENGEVLWIVGMRAAEPVERTAAAPAAVSGTQAVKVEARKLRA
jgi:tRNA(Ile)-lysidine synthase